MAAATLAATAGASTANTNGPGDGTWPFTPGVMRTALERALNWVRREGLQDTGEEVLYGSNPWPHLKELAASLADGSYRPAPMELVPYPKKGDRIRPYTIPRLRDQIAHCAIAAVLGPMMEGSFSPVSFGNRLQRHTRLRQESSEYELMPFNLGGQRMYQDFADSYGLFRRVAQAIVGVAFQPTEGPLQEEPRQRVPFLHEKAWLKRWSTAKSSKVYWAKIDLEMAYPSVDRTQIPVKLRHCATRGSRHLESLDTTYLGLGTNPWEAPLAQRSAMAEQLGALLATLTTEASYQPWEGTGPWQAAWKEAVPSDEDGLGTGATWSDWQPDDATRCGLPTGLATSGLLLNCLLNGVDHAMVRWIRREAKPVAYLRFADDMLILARRPQDLILALGRLRTALPKANPGFRLNTTKASPKGVLDDVGEAGIKRLVTRHALSAGTQQKFTTDIVRNISGEASEQDSWVDATMHDSGLDRMLFLAANPADDDEMTQDAQLAYALSGIARRRWPREPSPNDQDAYCSDRHIQQIRGAARRAIEAYPARFRAWVPIMRIAFRTDAMRRPQSTVKENGPTWLAEVVQDLLAAAPRAAVEQRGLTAAPGWTRDVSLEADVDAGPKALAKLAKLSSQRHPRLALRRASRNLRGSFIRAQLWRSYASFLRSLNQEPAPRWTSEAGPRQQRAAIRALGDPSPLVLALYGDCMEPLPWWEREALTTALLACTPASQQLLEAAPSACWGALRRPPPEFIATLLRPLTGPARKRIRALLLPGPSTVQPKGAAVPWLALATPSVALVPVQYGSAHELECAVRNRSWRQCTAPTTAQLRGLVQPRAAPRGEWENAERLDSYRLLRDAWRATGATPTWQDLVQPLYPALAASAPPAPAGYSTLRDQIYGANLRDETQAPTRRPPFQKADELLAQLRANLQAPLHPDGLWIPSSLAGANAGTWQTQTLPTSAAPHPAFLFPETLLAAAPALQPAWREAALELWVRTGNEEQLSTLLACAPWAPTPWLLRHVADECGVNRDAKWLTSLYQDLLPQRVLQWERRTKQETKHIRHVRLFPNVPTSQAVRKKKLNVLLVQAKETGLGPDIKVASGSLRFAPGRIARLETEANQVLNELRQEPLTGPAHSPRPDDLPDLAVFPECYFGEEHVAGLRDFAAATGTAVLAGLLPCAAKPLAERHPGRPEPKALELVNEAILIVPDVSGKRKSRHRTVTLRVRKPEPSIPELAMAANLGLTFQTSTSLTCVEHPRWGNFTFALCSDILRVHGWADLRGRIQHFFLLAHNSAVDLFDRFSYTRGYELYCNIVVCNHGESGGSVAWTPRRQEHDAELFRTHGANHRLVARIELPVHDLERRQREALPASIKKSRLDQRRQKRKKDRVEGPWWSPPPSYHLAYDVPIQ